MLRDADFREQQGDVVSAKGQMTVDYLAVPDSVAEARAAVVDFARIAGIGGQQLENLRLAVSEAVSNVVRHAYPSGPGPLSVTVGRAGEELWVLVADRGCGHQTRSANPGLGLGLGIIAHECDEMVITERAEGGTEVRMRFLLGPKPADRRDTLAGRRQSDASGQD